MNKPNEEAYMERALELAERARGRTSPNPMVGSVIVKDGEVVGEGYHEKAGLPHAEINALRQAGEKAAGATMYVTLEPCNFQGRTPPCTDAIISAGIKNLVVSAEDPNPKVAGKGIAVLKEAGVVVSRGLLKDKATAINEAYNKHITTGLPFVTVKAAVSLDGKIATKTGSSRWITGEESRKRVHVMRAENDVILTGSGTVNADNPSLTARLDDRDVKQPVRVILDSDGSIDENSYVIATADEIQTIIFATENITLAAKERLEGLGIEVIVTKSENGRVPIKKVLVELGRRGIVSVVVEAGKSLTTAIVESQMFDKLVLFVAPILIGGEDAPSFFAGTGADDVKDAMRLNLSDVRRVGNDVMICLQG